MQALTPLVRRMRDTGQMLCAGHSINGILRYWLHPSQRLVSEASARRSIPHLEPSGDGLLPGSDQTWRYADRAD